MHKRLALVLFSVSACGDCSGEEQTPAPHLYTWPQWPVRLELADNLTPCQRAGIIAGIAYWEALLHKKLIDAFDVSSTAPSIIGIPTYGVVGVLQAPGLKPNTLDQVEWIQLRNTDNKSKLLHSAEMRVSGCAVRAYAHEIGHVLGLGHAHGENLLMTEVHNPDGWLVLPAELASILETPP